MSFGIFEAATAEDLNGTHRKKLAGDRLAQAAAEVDHKLGPMLAKSTSVNDYHDRVRLAEKDFRNIVGKYLEGDSGFIAVAKKLEPHYTKKRSRTASRRVANVGLEDLREIVQGYGVKTRKRRGRDGFTFPAASGANGAVSVRPNGEIVVETLFGGGAGGMQSVYSPNEIDLVEDWIEKTVGGSYRLSRRKRSFDMDAPRAYTTLDEALAKEIRTDSLGIPYQNVKWDDLSEEVFEQTPKGNWQLRPDYRETRENFGEPLMDAIYRNTTASRRKKANGYSPEQAADIISRENPGVSFEEAFHTVNNAMGNSGMSHLSEAELVLFLREMKRISSRRKQASDIYQDFLEYAQSAGHDLEKIEQLTSSPDPMDHDHWEVIDFEESMYDYLGADSADDDPRIYDLLDMMGHHGVEIRANRRKQANPWKSPDDALGSGYFPGWQTDHNEDGWWQINSPDGSDALVGEEDGSYTMRMDAETPEEAWAERMNFDEALQESEALHYRKSGSRRGRQRVASRNTQTRGLRRR